MTACAPESLSEAVATAVGDTLTDRLAVERLTRTPDSSGGTTEGYTPTLADVPCRIVPSSGGEGIIADRLGLLDAYTITVAAGVDIRVTDELVAHDLRFHVQAAPLVNTDALTRRVVATVTA